MFFSLQTATWLNVFLQMNYASSDSPSSCGFQDGNSRCTGTTTSWDSGIGGLSATTTFGTQLEGEIFIPKWSQFSAKRTTCCIWSRIVGV